MKTQEQVSDNGRTYWIYPGTFDPITRDIFILSSEQSCLVDRLVVAVAGSQRKSPLFTTEQRLEMVERDIGTLFGQKCPIEGWAFEDLLISDAL